MEMFDWPVKILLAFVLGAVIGLEREINERKNIKGDEIEEKSAILGLRSFSLMCALGSLSGLLYFNFPIISALIAVLFGALMLAYYFFDSKFTRDIGLTTELAMIMTFAIGFLLTVEILPAHVIIALTVVLVLLMSRKENIKSFVEDISKIEINAFISFAILAFVILPFLPNESFSLSYIPNSESFFRNLGIDISNFANVSLFNPFQLWFIVVLITGVDLLGYILERTIGGKKGWLITSLVGGFVSSTATTITIAQESKKTKNHNNLLAGAVLATLVSFLPVVFLLATLNAQLLISFIPVFIVIILSCLFVGLYFLYFAKDSSEQEVDQKKIEESHHIFDLVAALRFVGIFLVINIASKIAIELLGETGFLITTGLGALTGIDAVVINTAQLAGNQINLQFGVWALILANAVNLFAKSFYSYIQGSKEFALKFFISMLVIIGASVIAALAFLM